MENKMEMSLDEIIKSNKYPRGRGGRKGGRKGGRNRSRGVGGVQRRENIRNSRQSGPSGTASRGRSSRGNSRNYSKGGVNGVRKHDLFEGYGPRKVAAATMEPTKLIISNLCYTVSDSDIQDVFKEFRLLKSAAVHHDKSGRSLGTADVIFMEKTHAIKAMKQYNGVLLHGRAMEIQITTSDIPNPIRK